MKRKTGRGHRIEEHEYSRIRLRCAQMLKYVKAEGSKLRGYSSRDANMLYADPSLLILWLLVAVRGGLDAYIIVLL